ncbi:MAG TPA: VOC family protein [Steroidobacteraceae bacterium]|nr:VOC family protein [Steroidobacteraceae bacterium]
MSTAFKASRDVIIRTHDLEKATRFYADVMHLPVIDRSASMNCVDAGAFRLYIEQGPKHGPVFDFLVPNFNDAKRLLVEAGCVVVEDNPSVPRCYLADPHGLIFNIAQA